MKQKLVNYALKDTLTEKQRDFVRYYAVDGLSQKQAAAAAGYSSPDSAGYQVLQIPHVREAVHAAREGYIKTELANLGLKVIKDLLTDSNVPYNVRFSAAKFSMELAGHGQRDAENDPKDKPLSEMSVEELEQFVAKGKRTLDSIKTISAPVIDIDAQDDAQGQLPKS